MSNARVPSYPVSLTVPNARPEYTQPVLGVLHDVVGGQGMYQSSDHSMMSNHTTRGGVPPVAPGLAVESLRCSRSACCCIASFWHKALYLARVPSMTIIRCQQMLHDQAPPDLLDTTVFRSSFSMPLTSSSAGLLVSALGLGMSGSSSLSSTASNNVMAVR